MLKICSLIIVVIAFLLTSWSYQKRDWKDNSRLILYDLNPAVLISLDPVTKELVVITLPDNLEIESVSGRGMWMLSKFGLAGDADWIRKSLSWYLGIANIRSEKSLNIWDKLRYYLIKRSAIIQTINLADTGLVDLEKTTDGIEVFRLNPRWDLKSQDWFGSSEVIRQGLVVTIVNTTSSDGLGAKATRLIESAGIRVRMLSSTTDNIPLCKIFVSDKAKKLSGFRLIQDTFGCQIIDDNTLDLDIKLELGKDTVAKLFG